MRVLAIDPGFDRMGIAVLEGDPSKPTHIWSDCLIPAKGGKEVRLAEIQKVVSKLFTTHAPDALALETLFFSKNTNTALGVAEARGVVLAAAGCAGCRLIECSPQEVKLAVTGYGVADKAAIARMIPHLISLPKLPAGKKRLDDELDAIALGIAALAKKM